MFELAESTARHVKCALCDRQVDRAFSWYLLTEGRYFVRYHCHGKTETRSVDESEVGIFLDGVAVELLKPPFRNEEHARARHVALLRVQGRRARERRASR